MIFLPPLTVVYYYGVRGYNVDDSIYSVVWGWATDTAWAEGYSEKKFAKVRLGMTRDQVQSIMGKPIWEPNNEYWSYTRSPSGTHYHQRGFVFSESGHVEEIVKGFYFD